MGATVQTMTLRGVSGSTYMVSLYFAGSDAAGYRVPASMYLAAASTSPTEFTIPEPCIIKHISGPATGTLRLLADGVATPILINTAAVISQAANASATFGQLAGVKNGVRVRYSLVCEVAMAA